MIAFETTWARGAKVITRVEDFPEATMKDLFSVHEALADLEALRGYDAAWHARAELIVKAGVPLRCALAEADRIRSAIQESKSVDDEPRPVQASECPRCGRRADCSCD